MKALNAILSITENYAVGQGNGLAVFDKEDMKFFSGQTIGHYVVMGRKTWQTLPGDHTLKGRTIIVVSRQLSPENLPESVLWVSDPEMVFDIVPEDRECYVCGGVEMYRYFFQRQSINTVYMTQFLCNVEVDDETVMYTDIVDNIIHNFHGKLTTRECIRNDRFIISSIESADEVDPWDGIVEDPTKTVIKGESC